MKVLITGSAGTIGTVLTAGLQHEITPFDLPAHDARSLEHLARACDGHDAVVHLAWDAAVENYTSGDINPDNALMAFNAYRAAELSGVRRVVMASSVHADDATRAHGGPMSPAAVPTPDSPYGATKVFVEALGRYYAGRALEVACVRFGGVQLEHATRHDFAPGQHVHSSWLSHHDCVALVDACLTAEIPANFTVVYGVSESDEQVHDTSYPLGWAPRRR